MDARVERFAGEQQVAKVAAIIESGAGGDIAVSATSTPTCTARS